MFRALLLIAFIATAVAFAPTGMRHARHNTMQMNAKLSKSIGAAGMALTLLAGSAMAVEGAAPSQGFFGFKGYSSPYFSAKDEGREDEFYSPYSPFGDGSASVYKTTAREGGKEEISFWTNQFTKCVKRTEAVPGFAKKKQWENVKTELTSYSYNMREAMLRLAQSSKDKEGANAAAKAYFVDLNDIFEAARGKNLNKVEAVYAKSLDDLAAFKKFL